MARWSKRWANARKAWTSPTRGSGAIILCCVSLGNTGEVLSIVNRSGNRPSHEGAAAEVDRALRVCLEGGFRSVLLRGDTDFSQTKHLDRWAADQRVQFIFGLDNTGPRHVLADDLLPDDWQPLERPPRYEVKTQPRARPDTRQGEDRT